MYRCIKTLSPREVTLWESTINGSLFVQRKVTKEALSRILSFYETEKFPFKPNIFCVDYDQNILKEEYITGPILDDLNHQQIKKIIKNIEILSKKEFSIKSASDYIDKHFEKKLASISLTKEQKEVVFSFLKVIQDLGKDLFIINTRVHGDLKGDNIIEHKSDMIFIDWERCKIGNFMEDVQKIIEKNIHYEPIKTDILINELYKYKAIPWDTFIFLDMFHFFLNQVLNLSKNRINLTEFKHIIDKKINQMLNSSLYKISINNKQISMATNTPVSSIIKNKEKVGNQRIPESVMYGDSLNNQKQRLNINKELMLKYKNFVVLHGACIKMNNGETVLIAGKSGAGKSYVLNRLKEQGVIQEIFDEDLITLNDSGNIKALGDKNFKGKDNENYIYEDVESDFGSLDNIIFIDKELSEVFPSSLSEEIVKKYLIHEDYEKNIDIQKYYKDFFNKKNLEISLYIVGNKIKNNSFNYLIDLLGRKSS